MYIVLRAWLVPLLNQGLKLVEMPPYLAESKMSITEKHIFILLIIIFFLK